MIKIICDGCGKDGTEELGIVQKRHYCSECAVVVAEYLAERDKLHDEVAGQWKNGLTKLERSYDIPLPA